MTEDNWTSTPVYYEEAALISKKAWDSLKNLKQEGSNLVDDTGHLYFQCETCDDLFDPKTTSFKTLHDKTRMAGWIVKWNNNGQGYKIYCIGCKGGV